MLLAQHGLTVAAYHLMCTAGYRIPLPRSAFIGYTRRLFEIDVDEASLIDALGDLYARGLMTTLSDADIAAESSRVQQSAVPELLDPGYAAGHVDFTQDGYRVHRDVLCSLFGPEHVAGSDSGFRFDELSVSFLVLAPSRERCEHRIQQIQEAPEQFMGRSDLALSEIEGPHPIGRWRPNRFIELEDGFRAIVRCRTRTAGP